MSRKKQGGSRGSESIRDAETFALGILAAAHEVRVQQRANREWRKQYAHKKQEAMDCFRALVLILDANAFNEDELDGALAHGRLVIEHYIEGKPFADVAAVVKKRLADSTNNHIPEGTG